MKKVTILAVLILLLAACGTSSTNGNGGGNGGGGNGGGNGGGGGISNQATAVEALNVSEEPSQSGDEETVESVSEDGGSGNGLPFDLVPNVTGFNDIINSAIGEWQCQQTDAQGDLNDADDDGIAENATYKYECSKDFAFAMSPVKVTRKGTITAQDKDDSDPYSGYKMSEKAVYSYSMMGVGDVSVTREFQRDWSGNAHDGYTFEHNQSWSWSLPLVRKTIKVEREYRGSYTPDNADHPFDQGQLVSDGAVKHYLNGAQNDELGIHSDLHVNSSCQPAADSGAITFSAGGNTVKTVEFSGCGVFDSGSNNPNHIGVISALAFSENPAQSANDEATEEAAKAGNIDLPFDMIPDFAAGFLKVPSSAWDCSGSSASGDTSDNDGDGIPANASYIIQCSKTFEGILGMDTKSTPDVANPIQVQRSGILKLADKDDNNPHSGFTVDKKVTYSYDKLGQSRSASQTYKRDWTKEGDHYTLNDEASWSWDDKEVKSITTGNYTPDNATTPFTAGDLDSETSIENLVDGVQQNLVEVSANLHVNSQCTPPADSGSVTFSVAGVDKTVNINSCQHQ